MNPGHRIDYKSLRRINPETTRLAVLEYLKINGNNLTNTARVFGINRTVVYDILRKEKEGDLKDRPRKPRYSPNKTPDEAEGKLLKPKTKPD